MTNSTKAKQVGQDVQDEVFATVRNGQAAVVDAFTAWSEAVRSLTPAIPATEYLAKLPTFEDVVSSAYDIAEKGLATQREFVEKMVAVTTGALPKK